ncbi:MAG: amino acid aminotransferase, partial [Candidatus Latescibacteria bacterium]|nr:amino acid aminotransferase [Candidatus Latescibacterota bacterium]
MFEALEMAPADPILGLNSAFKQDPNPNKINLGVGVYKDAGGNTPIFESVKTAEERLLANEDTKNYLDIEGDGAYNAAVQTLLWGEDHEIITSGRAATAQAPGGTGALRVAGDFIHQHFPRATLWLSDPTWANHPKIFASAEVPIKTYRYYDDASYGLDFDALIEDLGQIPAGDVVLLHGCCHNPTGVDPTPAQWEQIADVVADRGVVPLVDFAYQGLGNGLAEDASGLRALSRSGCELLVASSFSKSFGLYRERTGALSLVAKDADAAEKAMSHLKICIRTNYSNPPSHGAQAVVLVLSDPELRAQWDGEVKEMRDRINGMRTLFVDTLEHKGVRRD